MSTEDVNYAMLSNSDCDRCHTEVDLDAAVDTLHAGTMVASSSRCKL
jgi:hypothetical protein